MDNIKNGKLIYHLTSIENLDSIIKNGLQPRNSINPNIDIADSEIIDKRQNVNDINLLEYVPFHFFINNPFDNAVKKRNKDKNFIYICVRRDIAKEKDFKIIPVHPISNYITNFQKVVYNYEEGIDLIDWNTMEKRDYDNDYCKKVCSAECLYHGVMPIDYIYFIAVKDENSKNIIDKINNNRYNFYVNINEKWFFNNYD